MKQKTLFLFLLRFLKIGVAFINLSLTAKYFGVSLEKDIWILSFTSVLVFDAAVWGAINETFRVKFLFIRESEGEVIALDKTKSLLFYSFFISILMVLFIELFPNIFIKLVAPTFEKDELKSLLTMIKYVAPCLLFHQLSNIGVSVLNAYESFYIPEYSNLLSSILNLVFIVLLAPTMGIYSLLVSYYIGVFLFLILIFYQIKKKKILIFEYHYFPKFKDFYIFFLYALPFFVPFFIGQSSRVIEKNLVSSIDIGMVSALDYSKKFSEILSSVLTSVLATILVPLLSVSYTQKKDSEFIHEFLQTLQIGFLILSLFIAIFTSSSLYFVNLLYQSGTIDTRFMKIISELTMMYSWTTLPFFIYLIFGMALLSSGKEKMYAVFGTIMQVLNIIFNYLLIKKIGVYIIPYSIIITNLVCGLIMYMKFPFEKKDITKVLIKYSFVLILTVLIHKYLTLHINLNIHDLYILVINSVLAVIILFFMTIIFRLEESFYIINLFKRVFKFKS